MVATIAYALRYAILIPLIGTAPIEMEPTFGHLDFFLLTLMLILLTAAGNMINDYFDLRVDRINKPQRIVIDKYIKRRVAMAAHITCNVFAVLIGLYLSWKVEFYLLAAIPFFIAASLWYYSISFKKQFLIGNVVVALMAALLPIIVGLFEIPVLFERYIEDFRAFCEKIGTQTTAEAFFILLWKWILSYAAVAFLITLVREIQKDMEDVEGDRSGQYRTLPIVWGVSAARKITSGLLLFTIGALVWLELYILEGQEHWMHGVFLICLTLPLILSLYFSAFGRGRKSFSRASFYTKLAFFGILPVSLLFMYLIGV